VFDDDENPKRGMRTPLAEVDAATCRRSAWTSRSTSSMCSAFVVKSSDQGHPPAPGRHPGPRVQTQCLWTILRAVAGLEPPAVKDPDPDKPLAADEG
jgi:hypothetical protein